MSRKLIETRLVSASVIFSYDQICEMSRHVRQRFQQFLFRLITDSWAGVAPRSNPELSMIVGSAACVEPRSSRSLIVANSRLRDAVNRGCYVCFAGRQGQKWRNGRRWRLRPPGPFPWSCLPPGKWIVHPRIAYPGKYISRRLLWRCSTRGAARLAPSTSWRTLSNVPSLRLGDERLHALFYDHPPLSHSTCPFWSARIWARLFRDLRVDKHVASFFTVESQSYDTRRIPLWLRNDSNCQQNLTDASVTFTMNEKSPSSSIVNIFRLQYSLHFLRNS